MGRGFSNLVIGKPLCCILKANIRPYVNYNSIKRHRESGESTISKYYKNRGDK